MILEVDDGFQSFLKTDTFFRNRVGNIEIGPRGRVLGAGIVGHDAGEMIALWSLAVARRLPIEALASYPAPWLTRAEISRRVAAGVAERDAAEKPGLTAIWRRRIIAWLRKLG